ncbi:hypothetical protein B0H17DRAFT_1207346 [Mycena rosella]|uniref:Uncharacterized protein n=1 Tax=Mycena rosella TaxID=1033263 RepID=A0AAD7GAM9_MYCRO|nr:hypothetical protein B0H17DRAFT_1207346 [Mycena rosella]
MAIICIPGSYRPRRERTAQDRAISMSTMSPSTSLNVPSPIIPPGTRSPMRPHTPTRPRLPLPPPALGRQAEAERSADTLPYDAVAHGGRVRMKLPSPFGRGELAQGPAGGVGGEGGATLLGAPAPLGGVLSPDSFDGPVGLDAGVASVSGAGAEAEVEEESRLPSGVFTLLADCYGPTCSRDQLCYSIACPRRLEQQTHLNVKPQPGLRKEASRESLGDLEPDAGTL